MADSRKAALLEKLKSAPAPQARVDTTTGAPAHVRALVGAAKTPEDRLGALQQFYPDAYVDPVNRENFIFQNPETGLPTTYNPSGADIGDAPSLTREIIGQLGGAASGAALGSRAGPLGAVGGAMLGAMGGEEAVTLATQALGMPDTRSMMERGADTAAVGLMEGAGQGLGSLATKGIAAGTKMLMRGGEEGRIGVREAMEDAARFGASPTVAQATQKTYLDGVEQMLSKVPGGGGVIRRAVKDTTHKVRTQIDRNLEQLTGRAEIDPEIMGRTIISGVGESASRGRSGTGFMGRFDQAKTALYAKADKFIPDEIPVNPSQTREMIEEFTEIVPELPDLNDWLVSNGMASLREAFPKSGSVNYGVMRRIRTAVGKKMTSFDLVSDIPRSEWKRLYGALTEDIKAAAQAAGPEAVKASQRADKFYAAGIKRIDGVLEPLIKNKVPEMVAASLQRSVQKGGSTIRPIMRSLAPEERRIVGASIVRELGKARPGQQDAAGEAFSFETFLTNWNRLDKNAKDAMFHWPGMQGTRKDLDALAAWADRMRESSQAFANPSGTAAAVTGSTVGYISAGTGLLGLMSGNPSMLALPAVFAIAGLAANRAAHLMTSPAFVRWLSQSTKVRPNGWGAHLGRLGGVAAASDPAAKEAILEFMTAINQGGQNGN